VSALESWNVMNRIRCLLAAVLVVALVPLWLPGCCTCRRSKPPGEIGVDSTSEQVVAPEGAAEPQEPFVFRSSGKGGEGEKEKKDGEELYPVRPGEKIDSVEYNEILSLMDNGSYADALQKIDDLIRKYSASSKEQELLNYMAAECLFFQKNMRSAMAAYEEFIKQYPRSPMTDNAKAAINFISTIKDHKKKYVSPLEDKPGKR